MAFKTFADSVANDLVVRPLIEPYLVAAKFPKYFKVEFRDEGLPRRPDNLFHPSTHPVMPERKLFYYLTEPEAWIPEEMAYENRMAVIMGTAVHSFIQMCMYDAGILLKPEGTCALCRKPHGARKGQCDEFGVYDPVLGRGGHMDGILSIEGWGRGLFEFKCLALGTQISMADGSLMPVEKISEGDLVLAWDEQAECIVPKRVTGAWDNGVVPVRTVTTQQARQIGTTDEHPFLTPRGWVFAKDLRPGDRVRVVHGGDWLPDSTGDADEAWFLGVMVGDGGLTGQTAYFTSADLTVTREIGRYVSTYGARLVLASGSDITYRIGMPRGAIRSGVLDLLRREDLMGKGSREKRVPPSVWTGGPAAWSAFLSGYFDADGTVVSKGSYPHLSWASVNRELLVECQMLLAYLGIRASVQEINGTYLGEPHQSWRLLVRDAASVRRAMSVLSPRGRKGALLAGLEPKPAAEGHHLTATPGWDIVTSVEEGPAAPTIALEMEGGTHLTNGIVTHNTINPKATFGLTDNNVEWLVERHLDYLLQMLDYMDMTGMAKAVLLFCVLGFPWKLIEIEISYDHARALATKAKYERVRKYVENGILPDPCCSPYSAEAKTCEARSVCPIGRMTK